MNPKYTGRRQVCWAMALVCAILPALAEEALAEEPVAPGQPEYVEKITEEQLQVALARGPGERARLCIGFAMERLRELESLCKRNRHEYSSSLVKAWQVLLYEGAQEAARQGSRQRFDMRGAFEELASAQEESSRILTRLAGLNPPREAYLAMEEAAEEARRRGQETRVELERETRRVARQKEMLKRAQVNLRAAMIEKGMAASAAEPLSGQIMARCRTHSRIRVQLMLQILDSPGMKEGDASLHAFQANRLAETGAEEKSIQALVRALIQTKATHREQEKLAKEIVKMAPGSDSAATATRAVRALTLLLDQGMAPEGARSLLSTCRRLIKEGIPQETVLDFLTERIRAKGNLEAGSLENKIHNSLKVAEAIRHELKLKLREYRDLARASRDRAAKRGSGKGSGGG
ncbi:MAG: DUF5667 domain-containing protein [Planctomycetota bacterium]|jgi:hypothetical protein